MEPGWWWECVCLSQVLNKHIIVEFKYFWMPFKILRILLNELGDGLQVSSGWPSVTHSSKKGRLIVLDGRDTLQAEFNTFRPHGKFVLPPAWSVNLFYFYFLFALESKRTTWAPVLRVCRETSPVMGMQLLWWLRSLSYLKFPNHKVSSSVKL